MRASGNFGPMVVDLDADVDAERLPLSSALFPLHAVTVTSASKIAQTVT